MTTRVFWVVLAAIWVMGCITGSCLQESKDRWTLPAADGGQTGRPDGWWVDTWHDDGRSVTCWSNLRGFSCLPDAVVAGTPRPGPVDAGYGFANAICHDVDRGESCFVAIGGTFVSCLPDSAVPHR